MNITSACATEILMSSSTTNFSTFHTGEICTHLTDDLVIKASTRNPETWDLFLMTPQIFCVVFPLCLHNPTIKLLYLFLLIS